MNNRQRSEMSDKENEPQKGSGAHTNYKQRPAKRNTAHGTRQKNMGQPEHIPGQPEPNRKQKHTSRRKKRFSGKADGKGVISDVNDQLNENLLTAIDLGLNELHREPESKLTHILLDIRRYMDIMKNRFDSVEKQVQDLSKNNEDLKKENRALHQAVSNLNHQVNELDKSLKSIIVEQANQNTCISVHKSEDRPSQRRYQVFYQLLDVTVFVLECI